MSYTTPSTAVSGGTLTVTTWNTEVRDNLNHLNSYVNPTGAVLPYAGTSAPSGYLLCDGTSVGTADYPDLFSVVQYNYGGSGTAFNVPDLSTRMPIGVGNGRTEGDAGGTENVTLDVTQIPSHSHSATDSGHTHTYPTSAGADSLSGGDTGAYDVSTYGANGTLTTNSGNANVTIGNTGGGSAHTNMPPYLVMNYIIKT
jgi:microcystin-dependent protein